MEYIFTTITPSDKAGTAAQRSCSRDIRYGVGMLKNRASFSYEYNDAGMVTRMTYPDGRFTSMIMTALRKTPAD